MSGTPASAAAAALTRVHKHMLANRLRDLFASSPLVLVYQCLGNVRAAQIEDALRKELPPLEAPAAAAPSAGGASSSSGSPLAPVSFRVKNSLATSTAGGKLADLLQANNLLVGWQPQNSSTLGRHTVRRGDSLEAVLTATGAAATPPPARLPHQTFAALMAASLRVGTKHPVAPLAGFYCGQPLRISHLKRWSELDEGVVYAQLLAELEAVPSAIALALDPPVEDLLACVDALAPDDLLACLDQRGAGEGQAAAAAPAVGA